MRKILFALLLAITTSSGISEETLIEATEYPVHWGLSQEEGMSNYALMRSFIPVESNGNVRGHNKYSSAYGLLAITSGTFYDAKKKYPKAIRYGFYSKRFRNSRQNQLTVGALCLRIKRINSEYVNRGGQQVVFNKQNAYLTWQLGASGFKMFRDIVDGDFGKLMDNGKISLYKVNKLYKLISSNSTNVEKIKLQKYLYVTAREYFPNLPNKSNELTTVSSFVSYMLKNGSAYAVEDMLQTVVKRHLNYYSNKVNQ